MKKLQIDYCITIPRIVRETQPLIDGFADWVCAFLGEEKTAIYKVDRDDKKEHTTIRLTIPEIPSIAVAQNLEKSLERVCRENEWKYKNNTRSWSIGP